MSNKLVAGIIQKITNARKKAFEKSLPEGQSYKQFINKEVEKPRKYLNFLELSIEYILDSEIEIKDIIKEIKIRTNQDLDEDQLIKELWILRYAVLIFLFFDLKPPSNEKEVIENNKLINYAFQKALNKKNRLDYLTWLTGGFAEYTGADELGLKDLKEFKSHFAEKIAEKISLIPFNCTGGRLGGELHDSVTELIMTTISIDKKYFLAGGKILSDKEKNEINEAIEKAKPTEKDFEDFLDSLSCEK